MNKELTPMQEAIQKIENFEYVLHRKDVIDILTELLPKEKQVIENAFIDGNCNYGRILDYYNQKFRKDENTN